MLRIEKTRDSKTITPNLLPCRIQQDGPVDACPRYWAPKAGEGGKPEAYFRGRKLKGREIKLPQGYRGAVVKRKGVETESALAVKPNEEDEEPEEMRILEEVGSFDEIVVWGHENLADGDDAFVKGLEEWIGFSQAMHKPRDGANDAKLLPGMPESGFME